MHAHRLAMALTTLAACSSPPPSRALPSPEAAAPPEAVLDAGPEVPLRLRDWAEAWAALRDCMVGTPPEAADLVEAALARELLRGVDRCAAGYARVDQLARGAASDAGSSQTWDAVLVAVETMIGVYADGETGEKILDAGAIVAVDEATAAVYRAYDLVAPVPATGPSLPTLSPGAPIAVTAGLNTRGTNTIDHVFDGWVAKWGSDGKGRLVVRGPDDVTYHPYDTPLPAGTWTAEARGNKVIAGLTNAKGVIGRGATTVMKGRNLDVATTLGTGEARAVVVIRDVGDAGFERAWIVRTGDGGKTWDAPVALGEGGDVVVGGGEDAVNVYWIGPDDLARWQRITDPAELPAARVLGKSVDLSQSCSAGGAMWWAEPEHGPLHHIGIDGTVSDLGLSGDLHLAACTADGLVVTTADGAIACSATRCGTPARRGGRTFVDVAAPGEMVEASQNRSVVAVWEAGTPRLFRVGAANLIAVVRWNQRSYLGLETEDGLSFTPLP